MFDALVACQVKDMEAMGRLPSEGSIKVKCGRCFAWVWMAEETQCLWHLLPLVPVHCLRCCVEISNKTIDAHDN